MEVAITVDGVGMSIDAPPDTPLRYVLGGIHRMGGDPGGEEIRVAWSAEAGLLSQASRRRLVARCATCRAMTSNGRISAMWTRACCARRRRLHATYRGPLTATAPSGPSCSVADVRAGTAMIWSNTQDVYMQCEVVAARLPVAGGAGARLRVKNAVRHG